MSLISCEKSSDSSSESGMVGAGANAVDFVNLRSGDGDDGHPVEPRPIDLKNRSFISRISCDTSTFSESQLLLEDVDWPGDERFELVWAYGSLKSESLLLDGGVGGNEYMF